jgi:succinate-semialdehyde dehydrogenase/glutarate-semialdehyde dehydrogenase
MALQTRNRIGDEWVGADDGAELDVLDPATDAHVASVPRAGRAETRRAIEAAAEALPAWRTRPAGERAELLSALARRMLADVERLARLMTTEQGKPLSEARGEVAYAASFVQWAAEEARRVTGELLPAGSRHKRILVLRQPVGVTAAITPWNFPAAMITRKLGPALAAGCTMVVKPAEQTPLSAIALAELAGEVGLPPGVLNVVTGDPAPIGDELMENTLVRKVSFTGSTEVGKLLMAKAAHHVTRLSLELGGHAPFIVFEDADIDAAVRGAIASKFRNAGQTCICPNRFYVHRAVYDRFAAELGEAVRALRVGAGHEEGVSIGPLIDDAALAKVEAHVADARELGASVRTGGEALQPRPGLSRRFYAPTVLEAVTPAMRVSHEETFGPVVPLRAFEDEDEVIASANDSSYGLAAYFYTRDASRLMRVAEALEYGVIGANDGAPSAAQAPFGGMKQSGFGREGGHYAMDEYLDVKYVSWAL